MCPPPPSTPRLSTQLHLRHSATYQGEPHVSSCLWKYILFYCTLCYFIVFYIILLYFVFYCTLYYFINCSVIYLFIDLYVLAFLVSLTLSLLMSYIYGASSKARNLMSYIYGPDFLLGSLLLEPRISLIYA
jgi:hypothetical protein